MEKPPFYFGITTALTGREEGKTIEESDPKQAAQHARVLRVSALFGAENRRDWRDFIAANPTDPASIYIAERLLPEG